MRIIYDFSKLKGKIREVYKTDKNFCKDIGISQPTFISRIKCQTYFTTDEIELIAKKLHIKEREYNEYFFKNIVQFD